MTHPFPTIAGLALPKEYLARCTAGEGGHHALLLHGPAGIGKLALAIAYARTLMAPTDSAAGLTYDPTHIDAHLIAVGSHPDVLVFSRSRELLAEEARELIERLGTSPQRGPKRVLILDHAEQFNATVANLLLKTLEEPPPWGQFLLLTSSPEQLLPTIRSRTLPVPCREAGSAEVLAALAQYFPPAVMEQFRQTLPWVGGRVGDLMRFMLLEGFRHLRTQLVHFFTKVIHAPTTELFDLEKEFAGLFDQWETLYTTELLPVGGDLADLAAWREDTSRLPRYVNWYPEEEAPPATVRQRIFMALCGRLALAAWHTEDGWQSERGSNLLEGLRRAPRRLHYNANWSMVLEGVLLEAYGYEAGSLKV